MYTMYMSDKIYTVAEFRKCTREALNDADGNVDVIIERYGKKYWLISDEFMQELIAAPAHIDATSKDVPSIPQPMLKRQQERSMGFCKEGHPIPEGRSRCMGKGCKYS